MRKEHGRRSPCVALQWNIMSSCMERTLRNFSLQVRRRVPIVRRRHGVLLTVPFGLLLCGLSLHVNGGVAFAHLAIPHMPERRRHDLVPSRLCTHKVQDRIGGFKP